MIKGIDQKGPGVWWYSLSGRSETAKEALAAQYPRRGDDFYHGDVELSVTTAQRNTVVEIRIDPNISGAGDQLADVRQTIQNLFGG